MATLTIPITVAQLLDLARQLSPEERRSLLDNLLAEHFDSALVEGDRQRGQRPEPTDKEIQAELDGVRRTRRQERPNKGESRRFVTRS